MPTKQVHVQKAEDNESFANKLDENSQASVNWKLVVIFYAAMHWVEAYLAKLNVHTKSHTTRDNSVAMESNLKKIRVQYGHLKYFCYNARYEADQFTANDVKDALNYFSQVKGTLKPLT